MRYFIQKKFISELIPRKDFLYDTLSIWTFACEYDSNFIVLKSMPLDAIDACFLLGHNFIIKDFIKSNDIYEKEIVAITCDGGANFSNFKLKNKNLYLPHQDSKNLAPLLKGTLYGFDFDLTESEILFYNSSKSLPLSLRLKSCFSKY